MKSSKNNINYWKWIAFALFVLFVFVQSFGVEVVHNLNFGNLRHISSVQSKSVDELKEEILPLDGVTLPVKWGNLGARMVEAGVIDGDKLEGIYADRGGLGEEEMILLYGNNNGNLHINESNSGFLLNLLWALGLANQNPILGDGPMKDPQYGGDASQFASTGGWTLSSGNTMNHYDAHTLFILTDEQQKLVERVSKNIYRPCCGNSVYFPDCNHGMAMLGLLELMASQDVGEEDMYKVTLQVNAYWFPDTYSTIAKYFEKRGVKWGELDPKEVLGRAYSSSQGYREILSEVKPPEFSRGGSCGV